MFSCILEFGLERDVLDIHHPTISHDIQPPIGRSFLQLKVNNSNSNDFKKVLTYFLSLFFLKMLLLLFERFTIVHSFPQSSLEQYQKGISPV